MPYSSKAKYKHIRRRPPNTILAKTFRTVPIEHTDTTAKYPPGTKAIVGQSIQTHNWVIQAILIPK